jgi:putative membrane protein
MKIEAQDLPKYNRLAVVLSVVITAAVVLLMTPGLLPKLPLPFDPYMLPPVYAAFNALTAVSLVMALVEIKRKRIAVHQRMMTLAMGLSALFLVGYVLFHLATEPTSFGGEGAIRTVYYFLLLTHIVLAAVVLPLVLFTYIRGAARLDEKHRKLAKITFPIWLYVAVTGVICFLMISPYYPG